MSTVLAATPSVVNLYVSAQGLVTFPFLLSSTGWIIVPLMCVYVAIFHRAAQVLLTLTLHMERGGSGACTYCDLLRDAPPRVLVTLQTLQLIDMAGIVICYTVTLLDMALALQLPGAALIVLGYAYWLVARSRSATLQFINGAGVACSIMLVGSVLVAFVRHVLMTDAHVAPSRKILPTGSLPLVRPAGLWTASGVISLRLSGNIALPSMTKEIGPATLRRATSLGLVAVLLIYLVVGVAAVLTWGESLHPLLTQDLAAEVRMAGDSPFARHGVEALQYAIMAGTLSNLPNWFQAIGGELALSLKSHCNAQGGERGYRLPVLLLTATAVGIIWRLGWQDQLLDVMSFFGTIGSVTANAIGPLWYSWYVGTGGALDLALAAALTVVALGTLLFGRLLPVAYLAVVGLLTSMAPSLSPHQTASGSAGVQWQGATNVRGAHGWINTTSTISTGCTWRLASECMPDRRSSTDDGWDLKSPRRERARFSKLARRKNRRRRQHNKVKWT